MTSVLAGLAGVISFATSVVGGSGLVFGVTKTDTLFCSALLILIAIWFQVATIHHVMIERQSEIV